MNKTIWTVNDCIKNTGRAPEQDDLDRANCPDAGQSVTGSNAPVINLFDKTPIAKDLKKLVEQGLVS